MLLHGDTADGERLAVRKALVVYGVLILLALVAGFLLFGNTNLGH
jgi:hypothetical protein